MATPCVCETGKIKMGEAHARVQGQREAQVPNILILGTAEWNSPIATNQHYVTRELAAMGDVTFVESLGLRRPTLRRADVVRMASRLRRSVGTGRTSSAAVSERPKPERSRVVSPLVIPLHRYPTRALNTALLRRSTTQWIESTRPRVLWTFTPVTYGLEAAADATIYHCVDLLASFPGVDKVAVERGEKSLSLRADLAIATSNAVARHLSTLGYPNIQMLHNVADAAVFSAQSKPAAERHPHVLFSGNLTLHKLDLEVLRSVAMSLQGKGRLLLAGPLSAGGGDFTAALRELEQLGARYLGVLSHEELAKVAGTCSAGIIPYSLNEYTSGVSPLKCFEYLASGLTVVSTHVPAVDELATTNPYIRVASTSEFAKVLAEVLRIPPTTHDIADRMELASANGWEGRGQVLREILSKTMAGALGSMGAP